MEKNNDTVMLQIFIMTQAAHNSTNSGSKYKTAEIRLTG